jgi:DnaJ-class molecular chaperone
MHQLTLQMSLNTLGFSSLDGVDQTILKRKYHRLAQKKHPDKGGDEKEFILLRECYIFLRDFLDNPAYDDKHEASFERDFENEIQDLKDYISNLRKRIAEYETMIDTQISYINQAQPQPQLEQVTKHYEFSFNNLYIWYQQKQASLKKNYESGFVDILLARKKLSDQEYISLSNQLVENYNKQAIEIEREYSKKVIQVYRELTNKITEAYF